MSYIRWFQDISAEEIELVGGKGANLGRNGPGWLSSSAGFLRRRPGLSRGLRGQ